MIKRAELWFVEVRSLVVCLRYVQEECRSGCPITLRSFAWV